MFKLNVSVNENELDISFVRVAAPVVCNKSALGCHNYSRWVHSAACQDPSVQGHHYSILR